MVVAQLVRAPDCGSGGRRFETDLPPHNNKGLQRCSPFFVGANQLYSHKKAITDLKNILHLNIQK